MIYYKNRELSQKLAIKLAKWKRWVREFLPADPLGGLQSGYARQLNLREAYKVYLGGCLVSQLKFTIPEAQTILNDLSPWLKQHGFFCLHLAQLAETGTNTSHKVVYIYDNNGQNGFAYVLRIMTATETQRDQAQATEHYGRTFIGLDQDWLFSGQIASARVLSLTGLCRHFVNRIKG